MEKAGKSRDWRENKRTANSVVLPAICEIQNLIKKTFLTKKIATILLFSLFGTFAVQAQDTITPAERYLETSIEPRPMDRDRWSKLTEGIDFSEKSRPEMREPTWNENNRTRNRNVNPLFGEGTGAAVARFLLIVIGAVAIAFLVRAMLGYGRVKDKKINRSTAEGIDIQKIEENIHEADLVNYIDQAKENGDFNLAVRLYYLSILKELSLQKAIKWKVDKTNNEYLRELHHRDDFPDFQRLTQLFERSWYGNRTLDSIAFNRVEPDFQAFIGRLSLPASIPAE